MIKSILIKIIGLYQKLDAVKHATLLSTYGFTSYCKHHPSCSQYLVNQIKERGTIVGLKLGLRRLLSCH
ncbi:MAG: membrane protein insertion efficiency factor YidD [Patescibacteria group bacterium]